MHCGNDSMHGENVLNVMKKMSNLYNLKIRVIYLMQSVTYRFFILFVSFSHYSNEIEMAGHCGND